MKMHKYETIAEILTQRVKEGQYKDKFPSYRELVDEFKCSSRTIDQVIELLKYDEIIYTKRGQGTYVKLGG